jgi:hypothetical protein
VEGALESGCVLVFVVFRVRVLLREQRLGQQKLFDLGPGRVCLVDALEQDAARHLDVGHFRDLVEPFDGLVGVAVDALAAALLQAVELRESCEALAQAPGMIARARLLWSGTKRRMAPCDTHLRMPSRVLRLTPAIRAVSSTMQLNTLRVGFSIGVGAGCVGAGERMRMSLAWGRSGNVLRRMAGLGCGCSQRRWAGLQ